MATIEGWKEPTANARSWADCRPRRSTCSPGRGTGGLPHCIALHQPRTRGYYSGTEPVRGLTRCYRRACSIDEKWLIITRADRTRHLPAWTPMPRARAAVRSTSGPAPALIAQLRSVQPPLSESEITRERLSLEEAVRKVESEAAQRAREASPARRRRCRPRRRRIPPRQCAGRRNRHALLLRPRHGLPRRVRPVKLLRARRCPPLGQNEQRPPRNLRARCAAAWRPAPAAAADPDAGCRPFRRRPSRRTVPAAVPKTARRRCRRSRRACAASATSPPTPTISAAPRRKPTAPRENLCQRAVALAGIRPARAEHGKPRRRSRRALFV